MIAVVGLGFVGLATAIAFAEQGHDVRGFDRDPRRRAAVRERAASLDEPGVLGALAGAAGRLLSVVDGVVDAVRDAEHVFVCVGTPSGADGVADLSDVEAALDAVIEASRAHPRRRSVVLKSTVPPGTSARLAARLRERAPGVGLAVSPEFLREGSALADVRSPGKIVIGTDDAATATHVRELYPGSTPPAHVVSFATAEFTKYLSNALLATLVSFSNEMERTAEAFGGVDVREAFTMLVEDPRFSGSPAGVGAYLLPGPGFGGPCLPKDVAAFVAAARSAGAAPGLLERVLAVNDEAPLAAARRIAGAVPAGAAIGLLGLAFKPGTGDVRGSPALSLALALRAEGRDVLLGYDPVAGPAFAAAAGATVEVVATLEELVRRSAALVLVTSWPEFRDGAGLLRTRPLFDLRHFLPRSAD